MQRGIEAHPRQIKAILEVPSMIDEDKVMYFMSVLQSWAKLELQRTHVQTLSEAIAAVESFVEFKKKDQGDSKFKGKKDRSGSVGETTSRKRVASQEISLTVTSHPRRRMTKVIRGKTSRS
ncbi:hypothetical protein L3X38_011179 [Prunus dulcis]|uniref:Uncharacterized protein n=1 Tax=Prunus dulcis TaxID=3755 RepID=A0AAD4WHQ8_PRUDU|nr:hypothetical protein L3X38_011179 [Prunus dulcis]